MKPRIAVIGIGRWGKNLLREFSTFADVPYCVHKGNPETLQWLSETYPHIKTVSLEEVLSDPTIQAVVIATPIDTHFELAHKALEAGKHVFLEKPGCESAEQLAKIIALAEKKKLGLHIGYVFIYHPAFRYLNEHITETIDSVTCTWEKFGSFQERILLNLACHELSLLYSLIGISPTQQKILYMTPGISSGDSVGIRNDYSNGSHSIITINRMSARKNKSVTIVTKGGIWFWENNQVFKSTHGLPYESVFKSVSTPLTIECGEFVSMITTEPRVLLGNLALSVHASLASLR